MKKKKVVIAIICASLLTGIISFLGYYAIAAQDNANEPVFQFTVSETGKYKVGETIEVNCKFSISTFLTDNEKEDFRDWRIKFNDDRIFQNLLRDAKGNLLNSKGERVSNMGFRINESGQTVDENNAVVKIDDDGYRLDEDNNRIDKLGNEIILLVDEIRYKYGEIVSVEDIGLAEKFQRISYSDNGSFLNKNGERINELGYRINDEGKTIDASGNIIKIDNEGYRLDSQANRVDVNGKRIVLLDTTKEVRYIGGNVVPLNDIGKLEKIEGVKHFGFEDTPPGKIYFLETQSIISNVSQTIAGNKFNKNEQSFKMYFRATSEMKITDEIFNNLIFGYTQNGTKKEVSFNDSNKDVSVNIDIKNTADDIEVAIPDITAKCTSINPDPSVADEKVDVNYTLKATDFRFPDAIIAGNETIFLVDVSNHWSDGNYINNIKNSMFNKFTNVLARKENEKYGLVTFSNNAEAKITPARNNLLVDTYLVPQAEGNQFNDATIKNIDFNTGQSGQNIVAGFEKVKWLFDNYGEKNLPICKNVVLVVSDDFTFDPNVIKALKAYNYNIFTLQGTKSTANVGGVPNDTVEELHAQLGGIPSDDYFAKSDNPNLFESVKMPGISTQVAVSKPKELTFKGFKLTFNLGDYISKEPYLIPSNNVITKDMTDMKFVFVNDGNGNYVATNLDVNLKVPLEVYPRAIGRHSFGDCNIKYDDINKKPITKAVEPAVLNVINPVQDLEQGLQNGENTDMNSTFDGEGTIAAGTNATILAGATIYTKDVTLELALNSNLIRKGDIMLCVRNTGYSRDRSLTATELSGGKITLPVDMPRKSTVILRYTQFLPNTRDLNTSYINKVNYERFISTGNANNYTGDSQFKINQAGLPDLF